VKYIIAIVAALLLSVSANAAPSTSTGLTMPGQYAVTFFFWTENGNVTTGATQGLCLSANRTFASNTFPGWVGKWVTQRDNIILLGKTPGLSATVLTGERVTPIMWAGRYTIAYPGNILGDFGTVRIIHMADTCTASPAAAKAAASASLTR
jgi:hypothetical protein